MFYKHINEYISKWGRVKYCDEKIDGKEKEQWHHQNVRGEQEK